METNKTRVTAKSISKHILAQMEDTSLAWKLADLLGQNFVGKDISKRMATKVENELHLKARQYQLAGMYYLEVWKDDYQTAKSFLLGYETQGREFSIDKFKEHNTCHLVAADKRNERREEQAADTETCKRLASAINAHNKAVATMASICVHPYEERFSVISEFTKGPGPLAEKGYL